MSLGTCIRSTRLFQLMKLVNEDRHTHGEDWLAPGFHALAVHRVDRWRRELPAVLSVPLGWLCWTGFIAVRTVHGIELPFGTKVGRRVLIAHQNGIVIHERSVLGDGCTIRQNVTLGAVNNERRDEAPVLGRNVELGAGAVVVGRVTIGDGARIGPNAVVTTNVPAGARVFLPPPRTLLPAPDAPRPVVPVADTPVAEVPIAVVPLADVARGELPLADVSLAADLAGLAARAAAGREHV